MKPSVKELLERCPGVEETLIKEHLTRLNDDYFNAFDTAEIIRHLNELATLSEWRRVSVLLDEQADTAVHVTVLGFDSPSVLSLITGLMAATGFTIDSGRVCTYAPAETPKIARRHRRRYLASLAARPGRRRFIDSFHGRLLGTSFSEWSELFSAHLEELFALLSKQGGDGLNRAKQKVNEMVAARLSDFHEDSSSILFPVSIEVFNKHPRWSTLMVVSQDTPAFLYSLSNALVLRGISIEGVRIQTEQGILTDEIDVLDSRGKKIVEQERIDQLKLSVLLTKQFTYFLGKAPNPYVALARFEHMTDDVLRRPEHGEWLDLFSDPKALTVLARVLGASDYIWEDFIRSQYEAFLPMIEGRLNQQGNKLFRTNEDMAKELREQIFTCETFEEKRRVLNAFKDKEIFRIDLDHIIRSGADLKALSRPLTELAQLVVGESVDIVYAALCKKYGVPRTVGLLPAKFAVFGLGKLGGEALGYASDIELLFVYGDSGQTDGVTVIENAEFFDKLVEETSRFIEAKQEGIFRVDLRLRPYGESGHKACSLESFCQYYAPYGESHAYERLSLVRLRAIGGDKELGEQVERLRDEFIYESQSVDVHELSRLRERQFEVKTRSNGQARYNAKFSQGALVDIEYYVQALQVSYGGDLEELRTPRIHEALSILSQMKILEGEESKRLTDAYYFLRKVINGLRLLRGNALDLFLPDVDSDEYAHLARRMGYERGNQLDAAWKLRVDFETYTAMVRSFIERYFGREVLPEPDHGNVADLILSTEPSRELRRRVLEKVGFNNIDRAYINLLKLAGRGKQRTSFVPLAVLACDVLARTPDSDMSLNNWERFVDGLENPVNHYQQFLSQPRRLEILLGIMAGSQFLADTLVKNRDFLDWVTDPSVLRGMHIRERFKSDLQGFTNNIEEYSSWLNGVRRFRRREILRIGTRDLCLKKPIHEVMSGLSLLADTIVQAVLEREWREEGLLRDFDDEHHPANGFCIMALGKLGGFELNYSSDIDLLCIFDDRAVASAVAETERIYLRVVERVRKALSDHSPEGYAYRVDFRLRPHGQAGKLVQSLSSFVSYFENTASLWEVQALLKLRPIAGAFPLGATLIERLLPILSRNRAFEDIATSIKRLRNRAMNAADMGQEDDVKSGTGGIRDVEFFVQGLQLYHLGQFPSLFTGHTLGALAELCNCGILNEKLISTLSRDYLFLRRVEHYLQILDDRQTHRLPRHRSELEALAKRLFGPKASADYLRTELAKSRTRILRIFNDYYLRSNT